MPVPQIRFLRATAATAVVCLSYRNSVRPSIHPSVCHMALEIFLSKRYINLHFTYILTYTNDLVKNGANLHSRLLGRL